MDIYHIWCDLQAGESDTDFCTALENYLESLKSNSELQAYRITRRKLGLGIEGLGEFHIQMEFNNLAQLDAAFTHVSSRKDPIESFHHQVNSRVKNVKFSLYRDFPDKQRATGEEKF